ncbi:MAG: hypothetical protein AAGE98_07695 [Actinomycetota bacterium]
MTDGVPLDPSELDHASFELVRRGFDPMPVQRTLQQAAAAIRELTRERDALAARLADLESMPAEPLEAHRVAEALGVEATQVLEAAHGAAADRAERAEREAEAIRTEALAAAETIRSEAAEAREASLAEAERDAEAIVEDGRLRGRDMVNEAQVVRERMLSDLARKRQTGRAQVEQLRAGRDRLLESLSVAQQALDTAMQDLVDSVPEARAAAERAGMRVAGEVTPTVEVMEAEIEAARLVGHPLVEGIPTPGLSGVEEIDEPDPAFVTAEMEALTHVDEALEPTDDADDKAPGDTAEVEDTADTVDEVGEVEPDDTVDEVGEVEPDDTVDEAAPDADDADGADEADETAAVEIDEVAAAEDADEVEDAADATGAGADADDDADDDDGEADADDGPEDAVDDLFARIRESHDDADVNPDADLFDADAVEADDAADEVEDAAEGVEPEPVAAVDPHRAVRERAESVATRALKKVLVEEQSTLLDGIRRSGGDAVAVVVADEDDHAAAYERAAEGAFDELIDALGGDASAREVGHAQIRSIALDPVRNRLLEVADRSDDADELSDTVRGLYRESRSRRIPMAASAAVAAVLGAVVVSTAEGPVRWMIDPDGPCGPDCADNALAGSVEPGTTFPTGATHPPSDPTCTCWLIIDLG